MDKKKTIQKEVSEFEKVDNRQGDIDQKLDELLLLLQQSNLDSESIKSLQNRFNDAVNTQSDLSKKQIEEFKKFDALSEVTSREDMLDQFSVLLTNTRFDSTSSSKLIKKERASSIVLGIIGVVMIALGMGMIIMPAPPYFEMFTIFYFNHDDGVTIMDVISLLIILAGVYLLIRSINRKNIVRPT